MIRACEICSKSINVRPSHASRGQGRFCSAACRNKDRWSRHNATMNEWFWQRVDMSGGPDACWPWLGRRLKAGYGRITIRGRTEGAHRKALELSGASIPDGMFACHHCDNPPCCNPSHLYAGTHQQNVDDKVARGRSRGRYSTALKASSLPQIESLPANDSAETRLEI